MNELTAAKEPANAEVGPLAGEMARVVGEMVAALEKHWNLTRDQALDRIHEHDPRAIEHIGDPLRVSLPLPILTLARIPRNLPPSAGPR